MPMLQYAGGPAGPDTYQHEGVQDRNGKTPPAGFMVHGDMLERVEVFRYLGHLLSQDDDDIQAVRSQLCKALGTWARVGQVL